MKSSFDCIVRPLVTEKSVKLMAEGKYVFEVTPSANKIEIRRAIEEMFPQVIVAKVNKVSMPGKKRRHGKMTGHTKNWKKAIISLKSGKIDMAQEVKEK